MTIIKKFYQSYELQDIINLIDYLLEQNGEFIKEYSTYNNNFYYLEELLDYLTEYFDNHILHSKMEWTKLKNCYKVTFKIVTTLELLRL